MAQRKASHSAAMPSKEEVGEGPFDWISRILLALGILGGDLRKAVLIAVNVSLEAALLLAAFARSLQASVSFSERIEAVLIFVCNFHLACKLIVLSKRSSRLSSLFAEIELVIRESADQPRFLKLLSRNIFITKLVFLGVAGCFLLMHVVANVTSIIKHYSSITALPFQFYVPFDEERYFYLACAYTFGISVVAVFDLAMTMSLLVALVLQTTAAMAYLRWRLSLLGVDPSSEDRQVAEAIRVHQAVLRIVSDLNDLFGALLYVEFLLSSLQICIAGYQLLIARGHSDPRTPVFFFIFLLALTVPVFFCFCGNQIKLESERVLVAVYDNAWYSLSNRNRQSLLIMLTAAGRTLSISYRHLVTFDMEQYGLIVKSAYSLVATLQMMESNKFV